MRILGIFLNNEIRTGGHRRYLELMEGLSELGHDVRVIMNSYQNYDAKRFAPFTIPIQYVKGRFPPQSIQFRNATKKACRALIADSWKPDFIVVHGETHLLAGIAAKRITGARLLFGHRSNAVREGLLSRSEAGRNPLRVLAITMEIAKYRAYERTVARNADLIVFQSAYDRDDFLTRARVRDASVSVIGGNIGEPRFEQGKAGTNRSDSLKRVVFIGTYGARKGVRYLVEAISILARRGVTDVHFELIGPGEQRAEYEETLRSAGLAGTATLQGRVADPFPHIAGADLMIVPSVFDSYPDTVLEALHVGTPVIGTRVGGIPEMLVHDDLLIPPMDAVAIADRVEKCVRDPSFYLRLKALCAERLNSFHFNWPEAWADAMKERLSR